MKTITVPAIVFLIVLREIFFFHKNMISYGRVCDNKGWKVVHTVSFLIDYMLYNCHPVIQFEFLSDHIMIPSHKISRNTKLVRFFFIRLVLHPKIAYFDVYKPREALSGLGLTQLSVICKFLFFFTFIQKHNYFVN